MVSSYTKFTNVSIIAVIIAYYIGLNGSFLGGPNLFL